MSIYEPEFAWAAAWSSGTPRPFILISTIRATRGESIDCMVGVWEREGESRTACWKRVYRKGCRIIRIKVEEAFKP